MSTSDNRGTRTGDLLPVAILGLTCLLAFPPAGLATVTSSIDADGVLEVTATGGDDVTITCSAGKVLINGEPPGGDGSPQVNCTTVTQIVVTGGSGSNDIDLSGVTTDGFPNLADSSPVTVEGEAGNDTIVGSEVGDALYGGEGDDTIEGGAGADTIDGGAGNDVIHGDDDGDFIIGGDGQDQLYGDDGNDLIMDGASNDQVDGGDGDDTIMAAPGSTDTFADDDGSDTLNFLEAEAGITLDADLTDAEQTVDSDDNGLVLEGQFENITGSAFDDVITINALSDARYVDGGEHTTGDTLNVDARGAAVTDNGSMLDIEGLGPVTYANFETVNITNRGESDDGDDGDGTGDGNGDGDGTDGDDGDGTDGGDGDDGDGTGDGDGGETADGAAACPTATIILMTLCIGGALLSRPRRRN